MFLFDLSDEQKDLFIDLAIIAMESNGAVDDSEIAVIRGYCREMAVSYREKAKINNRAEVLSKLKDISSESELRKITIEITTLMYADNNLADEEEKMLLEMKEEFDFSTHLMGELVFAAKHLVLSLSLVRGITIIY